MPDECRTRSPVKIIDPRYKASSMAKDGKCVDGNNCETTFKAEEYVYRYGGAGLSGFR